MASLSSNAPSCSTSTTNIASSDKKNMTDSAPSTEIKDYSCIPQQINTGFLPPTTDDSFTTTPHPFEPPWDPMSFHGCFLEPEASQPMFSPSQITPYLPSVSMEHLHGESSNSFLFSDSHQHSGIVLHDCHPDMCAVCANDNMLHFTSTQFMAPVQEYNESDVMFAMGGGGNPVFPPPPSYMPNYYIDPIPATCQAGNPPNNLN